MEIHPFFTEPWLWRKRMLSWSLIVKFLLANKLLQGGAPYDRYNGVTWAPLSGRREMGFTGVISPRTKWKLFHLTYHWWSGQPSGFHRFPLRHWLKERPMVLFAAPTLASEDLPSTKFCWKIMERPVKHSHFTGNVIFQPSILIGYELVFREATKL